MQDFLHNPIGEKCTFWRIQSAFGNGPISENSSCFSAECSKKGSKYPRYKNYATEIDIKKLIKSDQITCSDFYEVNQ